MFEKEIEELNKAIKHLENDILPSKCNGNISCYNDHLQLYRWIKELKSYKEIQAKNNEDIFEEYKKLPKWKGKIFMKDEETCYKDGANFGYNKVKEEDKEKIQKLKEFIKELCFSLNNSSTDPCEDLLIYNAEQFIKEE